MLGNQDNMNLAYLEERKKANQKKIYTCNRKQIKQI